MDLLVKLLCFLCILVQFSNKGNGDRIKDTLYENMDLYKACFRRLNGTHQIGCSSDREGSNGVIHFCTTQDDLQFILKNGNAPPYVPLIPTQLLTRSNIDLCIKSEKVSGLVLYRDGSKINSFTHENRCPNYQSNVEDTCDKWNPKGTGLLYADIPFPLFYMENDTGVEYAKNCYNTHNNYSFETQKDRSLCVFQLSSFMFASKDSPTCIRRSEPWFNLNPVNQCDPLGGQNVWASLFPLTSGDNFTQPLSFKYIVISARMDTTSMFEKTAGAESPVTGIVALLATAKMLKEMLPENISYDKNVIFVLFDGETYDYIGSQRFVYDIEQNDTSLPPIKLEDISLFIELSQLANSGSLTAHHLFSRDELTDFLAKLSKNAQNIKFLMSNGTLPPSSLHTFLKADENIPGLVLADHKQQYFNKFYNSIYDNSSNINFVHNETSNNSVQHWIKSVSEMVAKSVYEDITKQPYQGSVQGNLQLIDELFKCYLEDPNCKVHQAVQKKTFNDELFSLYVGVQGQKNWLPTLLGLTLSWLTGDDVGEGNANCTTPPTVYGVKYYNMSQSLDDLDTTRCFKVFMNFTEALSPAFVIKGYNWTSGLYSTWTESTWGDIKMRVFLQPSKAHENLTISIGAMTFIFSVLITYFVSSRSDILFAPSLPSPSPTNC